MFKKLFSFSFFVISLGILLKVLTLNYYPDFSSYYYGPHAVFAGYNPYLGGKNFFTPFVYPPFVLLFFYPLSLFSFIIAEKIWVVLSIIFLFLSVILIFRIYKQHMFSSLSLVLFSLVFVSFPVKFSLGMGQINLFILLLVILFIYFFHKRRDYMAGFFLVLSIALKLFPVLLIFYLLVLRKWKILTSCIIIMLCIIFITAIFIRLEINNYFLQETLLSLLNSWKGDYYNQALSGFLMRQVSAIDMREFLRVLIGAIFVISSFVVILRKKKRDMFLVNLEISVLMTVSLLVNNFSWQHHFVWLTFPFFATFFYLRQKKLSVRYYFLLFLSYTLVAFNLKSSSFVPIILQSHVFYGGLLLWGLGFFLLFRDKS